MPLADGHTDCFPKTGQSGEEEAERFCTVKGLNWLKELLSDSKLSGLNRRLHGYSHICLLPLLRFLPGTGHSSERRT